MYRALDLGMSVEAFWQTTPRAIVLLVQEMVREVQARGGSGPEWPKYPAGGGKREVRLSYIPRP